jgi:uncharacterized protein (TIGR04255 family)
MPARRSRFISLSKQPLVFVLASIRFSPVRKLSDFLPAIQEHFRRHGFPLERSGQMQTLILTPAGVQTAAQDRWEYRSKEEDWSIIVLQDNVVLQTTAYTRFEEFAEKLTLAVQTVLAKTELDQFGVIERIGLRYIDLVQPTGQHDFRYYVRPGFHGISPDLFRGGTARVQVESTGKTSVNGREGTMIVRVTQNDVGLDLPPDLAAGAPPRKPRTKPGELVTLLDLDHFLEGRFEPNTGWIIERTFELHDQIVDTFHDHVVTPEAIREWR